MLSKEKSKKWVLITGANRGLGLALVKSLLLSDFSILAVVRSVDSDITALKALPNVEILFSNLNDPASTKSLSAEVLAISGGNLSVAVFNAGVGYHCRSDRLVHDEVIDSFSVNAISPILLFSMLLPAFKRSETHIVNVATVLLDMTMKHTAVYTASKTAFSSFLRTIKHETDLRITSIEPGAMETGFLNSLTDMVVADELGARDIERLDLDDIAEIIASVILLKRSAVVEKVQVSPSGLRN